jgi:hypothetical protein
MPIFLSSFYTFPTESEHAVIPKSKTKLRLSSINESKGITTNVIPSPVTAES